MRAAAACALLCFVVVGCGSEAQSPPVLQSYQGLKPILGATSAGSIRVAADSSSLAHALGSLQAVRVRRDAAQLGRDALRLENDAGRSAAGIRPLLPEASDGHVRSYLRLVLADLAATWDEAWALAGVARILPGDPWLTSATDARGFNRLEGTARREARLAVHDSSAAGALKRRYPRSFEYIAVRPARGTEAATTPHGGD